MIVNRKQEKRYKRHKRVRAKISGTAEVPRFCVFRSSKHIYAQLIDDEKGKTILNISDFEIKSPKHKKSEDKKETTRKVGLGYEVGKLIAKKAKEKKITKVVFDRGGYKYHGRVKAVAEGARSEGLVF